MAAWTVVHRAPHAGIDVPYGLALVALDAGLRVLARTEGASSWLEFGIDVELHVGRTVLGLCLQAHLAPSFLT